METAISLTSSIPLPSIYSSSPTSSLSNTTVTPTPIVTQG